REASLRQSSIHHAPQAPFTLPHAVSGLGGLGEQPYEGGALIFRQGGSSSRCAEGFRKRPLHAHGRLVSRHVPRGFCETNSCVIEDESCQHNCNPVRNPQPVLKRSDSAGSASRLTIPKAINPGPTCWTPSGWRCCCASHCY